MSRCCPNQIADPRRILVVDDIADNCLLLQTVLEQEGYRVDTADNGYAALTKIQSAKPDLLLLDVMMPGMDGYEVVRHIQQTPQLSVIPILLVTGYDQPKQNAQQVKVEGCLRKPLNLEDLLSRVQALLHHKSNSAELDSEPNNT